MKSIARDMAARCAAPLLLALCLAGFRSACAQTVRGRVVDERGYPVLRAEVQPLPAGHPVLTDAAGAFKLDSLPPGLDSIRIRRVGFTMSIARFVVPLTVARLTIVLHHSAAMLDTVHTSAIEQRLPRMFDRIQKHIGAALYGPALDSMFARGGSRSLEDMLTIDRRFGFVIRTPNSVLHPKANDLCIFVDGISVNDMPVEDFIAQRDIAAMEAFNASDAAFVHEPFPFEHLVPGKGWVGCGRVVLIWSKYYQQPPWAGH